MIKRLLVIAVALTAGLSMLAAPYVAINIDELNTDSYTLTFTPNDEVAGYAACQFDAGTAEQQFAMFGAWMGFTCMGDMIKSWGINATDVMTHTWTGNNPNTDYEMYVQAWDAEGNYADMIILPITTKGIGGDGEAEMLIEIGEFGGNAETGYYQWVTYTPNENVSLHRDVIIVKSAYESEEWGEENLLNYLKEDNPWDPYWNQYGVDEAQWSADPDTDYIAFSIGMNAKGEWGPLARVDFRTPGSTGIDEVNGGKTVAGVKYFNMAGQEMSEAHGICIAVTTYTGGTPSAVKVMK